MIKRLNIFILLALTACGANVITQNGDNNKRTENDFTVETDNPGVIKGEPGKPEVVPESTIKAAMKEDLTKKIKFEFSEAEVGNLSTGYFVSTQKDLQDRIQIFKNEDLVLTVNVELPYKLTEFKVTFSPKPGVKEEDIPIVGNTVTIKKYNGDTEFYKTRLIKIQAKVKKDEEPEKILTKLIYMSISRSDLKNVQLYPDADSRISIFKVTESAFYSSADILYYLCYTKFIDIDRILEKDKFIPFQEIVASDSEQRILGGCEYFLSLPDGPTSLGLDNLGLRIKQDSVINNGGLGFKGFVPAIFDISTNFYFTEDGNFEQVNSDRLAAATRYFLDKAVESNLLNFIPIRVALYNAAFLINKEKGKYKFADFDRFFKILINAKYNPENIVIEEAEAEAIFKELLTLIDNGFKKEAEQIIGYLFNRGLKLDVNMKITYDKKINYIIMFLIEKEFNENLIALAKEDFKLKVNFKLEENDLKLLDDLITRNDYFDISMANYIYKALDEKYLILFDEIMKRLNKILSDNKKTPDSALAKMEDFNSDISSFKFRLTDSSIGIINANPLPLRVADPKVQTKYKEVIQKAAKRINIDDRIKLDEASKLKLAL